jgi:hypothetical protein
MALSSLIDLPCSTLKTLTIQYSTESIMPNLGYTVQWRAVGTETWYTEPNKKANPIVISGVPSCYPLEVRLMVDCGTGLQTVETFGVQGSGSSSCYTFSLLDTGEYTYTPCGTTSSRTIYNNSSIGIDSVNQTICAVDGSVSGGGYSRGDQCLGNQR